MALLPPTDVNAKMRVVVLVVDVDFLGTLTYLGLAFGPAGNLLHAYVQRAIRFLLLVSGRQVSN